MDRPEWTSEYISEFLPQRCFFFHLQLRVTDTASVGETTSSSACSWDLFGFLGDLKQAKDELFTSEVREEGTVGCSEL